MESLAKKKKKSFNLLYTLNLHNVMGQMYSIHVLKCIHLFIFGCAGSSLLLGPCCSCSRQGSSLVVIRRLLSHCGGFSYCGTQTLGCTGFSSCTFWALEHRLSSYDT